MADQGAFEFDALEPEILPADEFEPKAAGSRGAGRPRGARAKHYVYCEKYLRHFTPKLLDKLIVDALAGDASAMRLCIERIYPRPLKPPATVDMPAVTNRAEALAAMQELLQRGAGGDVSLSDAVDLVRICGVIAQVSSVSGVAPPGVPIEQARHLLAERLKKTLAARLEAPAVSDGQPSELDALEAEESDSAAGSEVGPDADLDELERRIRAMEGNDG